MFLCSTFSWKAVCFRWWEWENKQESQRKKGVESADIMVRFTHIFTIFHFQECIKHCKASPFVVFDLTWEYIEPRQQGEILALHPLNWVLNYYLSFFLFQCMHFTPFIISPINMENMADSLVRLWTPRFLSCYI